MSVPLAAAAVTVGVALADLVAPGIRRLRSGARCIFPFSLGEQPIGLAGHSGEPCHIALGVVPSDVDHRLPTAPPAAVADTRVAIAIGNTGVPIIERHLEFGHSEGLGERDLVLRTFVVVAAFFIRGEPIMNLPAGMTTISGQSLAHSLKVSLGLSARSASAVST